MGCLITVKIAIFQCIGYFFRIILTDCDRMWLFNEERAGVKVHVFWNVREMTMLFGYNADTIDDKKPSLCRESFCSLVYQYQLLHNAEAHDELVVQ